MTDIFETSLDRVNRYFRYKLVTIIPTSIVLGNVDPRAIPAMFTGYFLEADDTGVWLLMLERNARDFFYHDKIVKIEEASIVDPATLTPEQRKTLDDQFEGYDRKRREEIKAARIDARQTGAAIPDVTDPTDAASISEMIGQAQKMVLEGREAIRTDMLEQRPRRISGAGRSTQAGEG